MTYDRTAFVGHGAMVDEAHLAPALRLHHAHEWHGAARRDQHDGRELRNHGDAQDDGYLDPHGATMSKACHLMKIGHSFDYLTRDPGAGAA